MVHTQPARHVGMRRGSCAGRARALHQYFSELETLDINAQHRDEKGHLHEVIRHKCAHRKEDKLRDSLVAHDVANDAQQKHIRRRRKGNGPCDLRQAICDARVDRERERCIRDHMDNKQHGLAADNNDNKGKDRPWHRGKSNTKQSTETQTHDQVNDQLHASRKGHTKPRMQSAHLHQATENVEQ